MKSVNNRSNSFMLPRPDAACFPFSRNIGSVSHKDHDYKEGERNPRGRGRERERDTGKEREREKQERIDQFILVRPNVHKNRYRR